MRLRLKGCANSRQNFSPLSYAEKVIQKILHYLELFSFEVTLYQETTVMLKLLQGAASGHFMSIKQLKYYNSLNFVPCFLIINLMSANVVQAIENNKIP